MNWRIKYEEFEARSNVEFDWATDGCSGAPDSLLSLDLYEPCAQHDFVYRNWWILIEIGMPVTRRQADSKLHKAIDERAKGFWVHIVASAYQLSVRLFGWKAWRDNYNKSMK